MDSLELLKDVKNRINKATPTSSETAESFQENTLEMTTWIDNLIRAKVAGRSAPFKTSFSSIYLTAGPENNDTTTNVVRFTGSDSGGSGEVISTGDLLVRNNKILARITASLGGLQNGGYTFTFEPSIDKQLIQQSTDTFYVYPSNFEEAK